MPAVAFSGLLHHAKTARPPPGCCTCQYAGPLELQKASNAGRSHLASFAAAWPPRCTSASSAAAGGWYEGSRVGSGTEARAASSLASPVRLQAQNSCAQQQHRCRSCVSSAEESRASSNLSPLSD